MLLKFLHSDNNNENSIYRDSLYFRFRTKQFACINIEPLESQSHMEESVEKETVSQQLRRDCVSRRRK